MQAILFGCPWIVCGCTCWLHCTHLPHIRFATKVSRASWQLCRASDRANRCPAFRGDVWVDSSFTVRQIKWDSVDIGMQQEKMFGHVCSVKHDPRVAPCYDGFAYTSTTTCQKRINQRQLPHPFNASFVPGGVKGLADLITSGIRNRFPHIDLLVKEAQHLRHECSIALVGRSQAHKCSMSWSEQVVWL